MKAPEAGLVPAPATAAMQPAATPGAPEIYIYYRARPEQGQALAEAALAMQHGLRAAWPGLGARLLRRPDLREGLATWMEAYALPPGADPGEVAQAIERAAEALAPWQASPRHVEHFVDGTSPPWSTAAAPGSDLERRRAPPP